MNIAIIVLQVAIIIGGYLIVGYIKKMPDQIHKKNLASFKNELQKEIVKLEASEGNLHLKKIEKFTEFTTILQETINSVKYKPDERKEIEERTTKAMELFAKDIIFFAGEETLEKFVEYRRYSKLTQTGEPENVAKFQFILAELILEMRKDLGFNNKGITVDHYMHILVNDWDKHKDEYHEKARKAKKLE